MKNLLTLFVLFFSFSVFAETVNLKCKCENCDKWEIDVKINIEKKFMQFGTAQYSITSITDDYITGIEYSSNRVGGSSVGLESYKWRLF